MHILTLSIMLCHLATSVAAYEVATRACCKTQLDQCHQQGAGGCVWTNLAVCVDNPNNFLPVDTTCQEKCPSATVNTPDGYLYKLQRHTWVSLPHPKYWHNSRTNTSTRAPSDDCVCSNFNYNLSQYCQGGWDRAYVYYWADITAMES